MLNDVSESLNLFVKNKYNRWQPPFVLLKDILYKKFAPQRCFILLFSVCVVGDSIYPEVTRYTLKYGPRKFLKNIILSIIDSI